MSEEKIYKNIKLTPTLKIELTFQFNHSFIFEIFIKIIYHLSYVILKLLKNINTITTKFIISKMLGFESFLNE